MSDMKQAIAPKSDQLNADDLIAGPRTVRITRVSVVGGQEQPVAIFFEGDNGKPYKPCKSMSRVMVQVWGADSAKYAGQIMTLYRDPDVKWGGMAIGGIRISHISGIDKQLTVSLTASKGKWKPFTVNPLKASANHEPATVGEVLDGLPPINYEKVAWQKWLEEARAAIEGSACPDELDVWIDANNPKRQELVAFNPKAATRLAEIITAKKAALLDGDA